MYFKRFMVPHSAKELPGPGSGPEGEGPKRTGPTVCWQINATNGFCEDVRFGHARAVTNPTRLMLVDKRGVGRVPRPENIPEALV